jgi:hypothetical protein
MRALSHSLLTSIPTMDGMDLMDRMERKNLAILRSLFILKVAAILWR